MVENARMDTTEPRCQKCNRFARFCICPKPKPSKLPAMVAFFARMALLLVLIIPLIVLMWWGFKMNLAQTNVEMNKSLLGR